MGISLEKFVKEEMIFVDSNAFIAIRNLNHPLHQPAIRISSHLVNENGYLITTNIVIAEVFTVLSMRVNKMVAVQFGKDLEKQEMPIVFIDEFYHRKAWEIFQKIKDKNVSFFDCTSFAVMEDLGIHKAFSFDKEFKKYGFEIFT